MDTSEQAMSKPAPVGTVGGVHWGSQYKYCNGLYRATDRVLPDGRQVYVCDVCGTSGARRVKSNDNY